MDIADALQQSREIRRMTWPQDWCIKPTDNELCCVFFSQEKSAPRWEPTKEDLIADDWTPIRER